MLGLPENYFLERSITDEDGCRIWQGGQINSGYGKMGVDGVTYTAHRAAYLHYHGEIPEGMVVGHSCDKRLCVNKSCLVAMTQARNIEQMYERDRQAAHLRAGERNTFSKISDKEVWQIKDLYACGLFMNKTIGEWYGLKANTVVMIGRNQRRQNVPNPYLKEVV